MSYFDNYDPYPDGPYSRAAPSSPLSRQTARRWLGRAVGLLFLLTLVSRFI